MSIHWRKWNRVVHRDLGFIFFGMTIIYALSGLALNHLRDWNPNYIVSRTPVHWHPQTAGETVSKNDVLQLVRQIGEEGHYKTHYFPAPQRLKIFLKGGSIDLDLKSGDGSFEKLKRRPLFYQVNFLHYNPGKMWTWFSDVFCLGLLIIAVSGLFIIKGKTGIAGRGALLTAVGIVIPFILLFIFL